MARGTIARDTIVPRVVPRAEQQVRGKGSAQVTFFEITPSIKFNVRRRCAFGFRISYVRQITVKNNLQFCIYHVTVIAKRGQISQR